MNVNLLTDAPKHNLALMKISAWHKLQGDRVWLNGVGDFDLTYGSWLFDFSPKGIADIEGGPGAFILDGRANFKRLDLCQQKERPDYGLFHFNYSLGYTWEYCPNNCGFCLVPHMGTTREHYSLDSFICDSFDFLCLLNNNGFSDPLWLETFQEIWDRNLTVIDENGYDLRLMDEMKSWALRCTKFKGYIHYAWDQIKDESKIIQGLKIAPRGMVYVLIGYDTTREEDFHRCQVIHDLGHDPYVMPYNRTKEERRFQRFINTRMYRKYKTLKEAWKDYN